MKSTRVYRVTVAVRTASGTDRHRMTVEASSLDAARAEGARAVRRALGRAVEIKSSSAVWMRDRSAD